MPSSLAADAVVDSRVVRAITANAVIADFIDSLKVDAYILPDITPAPVSTPHDIIIRFGGVDITGYCEIAGSEFRAAVNGAVGTCTIPLFDSARDLDLPVGMEITLDVDGRRLWGGYALNIERSYLFDTLLNGQVTSTPRRLTIQGLDYNVLLQKRFLHNAGTGNPGADETVVHLTNFDPSTDDDVVIKYYLANHTDLAEDGIDISTYIEHVGTPTDTGSGETGIGADCGWSVASFMSSMSGDIGSIWYIDPDKNFIYTDVDTPNAAFGFTDHPVAPLFNDDFSRIGVWHRRLCELCVRRRDLCID